MAAPFVAHLSFKGKTVPLSNMTTSTTPQELHEQSYQALSLSPESSQLKLLFKGRRLDPQDSVSPVFSTAPRKVPKIIVMATAASVVEQVAAKKSDPTIRGFDQEIKKEASREALHWGEGMVQDRNYKFCKFDACTWQSFGHRTTDTTPHAFAAMQLLQKLATDPGVVAIMRERELVVGTLGEMDPIDDRLMEKTQEHGGCLLGYNTNHGLRIDIKLRSDDLQAFRPYPELVGTLIHELSHNWVGEHNLLFWTNYAQMRAEYLHTHARLRTSLVKGKTTAELAGLSTSRQLENVFESILKELQKEMGQHGLHPNMIAEPIRQRCEELEAAAIKSSGKRLGGPAVVQEGMSARERALLAAERRRQEEQQKDKQ